MSRSVLEKSNYNLAKYQELVENLPVAVMIMHDNQLDYANPCSVEMLGMQGVDINQVSPKDFLHPSYTNQFDILIDRIKTQNDAGFVDIKLRKIDSNNIIEVEANGVLLDDGSLQLMFHDITSRKQLAREQLRAQLAEETNLQLQREILERNRAEKELAEAQKYTRRLIESSMDIIVATDIDYNITEFNPAAELSFGYKREDVIGRNMSILFSDEKEMSKVIEQIESEGSMGNEIVNRKKDDSLFISYLSASLVRNEQGDIVGAMGVSRDITSIKKAEEELRLSEERHRAIYDQAYIGIARIAKMGRFLLVNERLSDMLNYSPDELYKKTFYELSVPEEVEESLLDWDQLLSGKIKNFSREQTYVRKDGELISANVTVSLVKDAGGNPNYFVAVFEDITERKVYEKQLKESITEKEVLLKEVHHRVKNNMQVISSILNLQSSYVSDESALSILRESQDRIKSMSFVHESLYQSKTLSEVNFAEYIQNIVRNLYHSYANPEKRIDLVFELDKIDLNLDTSIPCGLIINEIVSNSLKYAFEGKDSGKLMVHFSKDNDGLLNLVISDDGIGLPKDFDIETAESLGLQLVTTLATQISGELEIDTESGTSIGVKFKEQ